jgi:hypothetical protein
MWYRAIVCALIGCPVSLGQSPSTLAPQAESPDASPEAHAPPWATLVGSTERNKYHRVQCGIAKKIKPERVIWFIDVADATENGYAPANCNDRKCQPPAPDPRAQLGTIGGPALPPPSVSPPELPPGLSASPSGKSKAEPARSKSAPKEPPRTAVAPPRMTTLREVAAVPTWQGVPPAREYEARWKWDVWATWVLDLWCERWHVSPGGRINTDTAYGDQQELQLLARLKQMKDQMEDNRKRMKELRAIMDGKKKSGTK